MILNIFRVILQSKFVHEKIFFSNIYRVAMTVFLYIFDDFRVSKIYEKYDMRERQFCNRMIPPLRRFFRELDTIWKKI